MKILVTGAGGRVGRRLIKALAVTAFKVRALARSRAPHLQEADEFVLTSLSPDSDFSALLEDMDAVIHLADGFNAYEHLPYGHENAEARRRLTTVEHLIDAAAKQQVSFIYLSTIKTMCGPFTKKILCEETKPEPQSLYGQLKLVAETTILKTAEKYGSTAVILRFPIVFGGDIGGNMERLSVLANKGYPLPFKGLASQRSLISANSLIDAVLSVLKSDIDGQHIFLLHDGSLTIEEIIRLLHEGADGKALNLFGLPHPIWSALEMLPVIGIKVQRFTKPLELDDSRFRLRFDWQPPTNLRTSLRQQMKHDSNRNRP